MTEENLQVEVFQNTSAMTQFAAKAIISAASIAISECEQFHFVLSGGSTPGPLYQYLANPQRRALINWQKTHIYWGDERCVPPDEDGSNYKEAKRLLLDNVPVSPANIHRIKGELSPFQAAEEYAGLLKRLSDEGQRWPIFDAVLLGMGDDGHTASLFPGILPDNLDRNSTIAVTAHYGDRPANRVTLTPQVFNSARLIFFLVAGESKSQVVKSVINGPYSPQKWPAQLIQPHDGRVIWLLDEAAASDLDLKM